MLPPEAQKAFGDKGFKYFSKAILPSTHPLQTPSRRSFNSSLMSHKVAELERQEDIQWGNHNPVAHSNKPSAIASPKKPLTNQSGSLMSNKVAALERQEDIQWGNHNPVTHSSPKTPPKPIPGSAADLPEARKKLQQARNAYQTFEANRTITNRGRVREMELQDLRQEASSAKERYMNSQGLDISGQPIKLTPPAPQQSKQDKSLWDRGKGLLGGYVNFQKDTYIGAGKGLWDMGKGLGSLAKSGLEFQQDVYTNPKKALQTLSNLSGNLQKVAKHPGQVWDALKQPYVDAINSGHPGEAFGRGFVDIGSFFVPGGAIGKAGEGANVLSKVSKVGDVTNTLSKVDKAGITVSRATNVADEGVEGVASIGKKYTFDTRTIGATPGKPLTFDHRVKTWRAMAEDPEAPLTEAQRQHIRNTPRGKSTAPTWDNPVTGRKEIMELSHEGKSFSKNVESGSARREHGTEVVPRWKETHVQIDKFRHLVRRAKEGYTSEKEAYTSPDGVDKIRKAFAEEVKKWGYKIDDSKL